MEIMKKLKIYKLDNKKIANLGIIPLAIKSAGRRYTITLLVKFASISNFAHSATAFCIPTGPVEKI